MMHGFELIILSRIAEIVILVSLRPALWTFHNIVFAQVPFLEIGNIQLPQMAYTRKTVTSIESPMIFRRLNIIFVSK